MDFKILTLKVNIGVDALGPKTDFTIEKYLKRGSPSGHQVVTKWSPGGHQVVTKWSPSGYQVGTRWSTSSSKDMDFQLFSLRFGVQDDTETLQQKRDSWKSLVYF